MYGKATSKRRLAKEENGVISETPKNCSVPPMNQIRTKIISLSGIMEAPTLSQIEH